MNRDCYCAEHATMADAADVVLGILAAKKRDNAADAAALMKPYFLDALHRGLTLETAWRFLFTAATLWLGEVADELAERSGVDTCTLLTQLALEHAAVSEP